MKNWKDWRNAPVEPWMPAAVIVVAVIVILLLTR